MHSYAAHNPTNIPVAVIGGSGYAGLELVRLLLKHPNCELKACFSAHASFKLSDFLPERVAKGIPVLPLDELPSWNSQLHTVFLSTPPEVSLELAPQILERGSHVVDLSGAFRLKMGTAAEQAETYQKWYNLDHQALPLLDRAIYGLTPWARIPASKHAQLISNPGCYATTILMALIPLLRRNWIDPNRIVIDAKSGTSGAGRTPKENLLFTEVEGECLPYRVGRHQHLPEICQGASALAGVSISPHFTTHLLNVRRGIIAGIYAELVLPMTDTELSAAFAEDYSDYGLVQWSAIDQAESRTTQYGLSLKRIVGLPDTRILYRTEGTKLYLFSLIDNLIKGAAGQAVENFNQLAGLSLKSGLSHLEAIL